MSKGKKVMRIAKFADRWRTADGRRQTVDGGGSAEKKISSKIIFFIDKKF
jgi:hypothetical protein